MAFILKKRIELGEVHPDWANCYLEFRAPSNKDIAEFKVLSWAERKDAEAQKELDAFITELFIEGKGFDGKEVVAVTKENVITLPTEILNKISATLFGEEAVPKAPANS